MSKSTKVFFGLVILMVSLVFYACMMEEKVLNKLYKEVTCYRDQRTEVPISDGVTTIIKYSGMIGNDTFVFHRSATHNSWSVYYKTSEKFIKHRGYTFEVKEVTPAYIILKPVKN